MNNESIEKYQDSNRIEHPEWTSDQIDSKSALDLQVDKLIDEGNTDITDEVIRLLIRRAQQWIEEHLPYLMERVRDGFEYLYNHIGDWLQKGIQYIADIITNYF